MSGFSDHSPSPRCLLALLPLFAQLLLLVGPQTPATRSMRAALVPVVLSLALRVPFAYAFTPRLALAPINFALIGIAPFFTSMRTIEWCTGVRGGRAECAGASRGIG